MYFFKTNSESFEQNFGKVVYPKSDSNVNKRFIIIVFLCMLIVIMRSNGGFDFDTGFFVAAVVVVYFFTLFFGPIHGRYLTTKGILIRSSIVKKDVFIPWEDITKVVITEGYLGIEFFDIKGKKYGFNYSSSKYSKRNSLFEPFMDSLKKFRPDLEETYVKYDFNDVIREIKKDFKANPWFVIFGIIIFIFILVTCT